MTKTKIEKLFVLVAEEDYQYSLWEWDKLTNRQRVQCVDDARNPDVSFIYNQEWIIQDGDSSLYSSLNELVGRECKIMTRTLIKEWNEHKSGVYDLGLLPDNRFEDGINPDPDDWENQMKTEGL